MAAGSVLFAAGRGTRLQPFTDRVPKAALPLLDLPLGCFPLAALRRFAPPVVINVSYLAEEARATLEPWTQGEGSFLVESPGPLGTGGTLAVLRSRLAATFVTANADVVSTVDLAELRRAHQELGAPVTVAVVRADAGADFVLDGNRVARLLDRRTGSRPGHAFTGIAVIEREAIGAAPESVPAGLTEFLLRPLIERGEVAALLHEGYFVDVGTAERYLRASLDLLEGRGPAPPARWPGDTVQVDGGSAYVGPGARVEGSLGPGAILLAGGVVAAEARVERAIVWPGETVPPGLRVADTVFCPFAGLERDAGSP